MALVAVLAPAAAPAQPATPVEPPPAPVAPLSPSAPAAEVAAAPVGEEVGRAIVEVPQGVDVDVAAEALVAEARRLGAPDPEVIDVDPERRMLLLDGVGPEVRADLTEHRAAARVVPDFAFGLALADTTAKIGADKTIAAGHTGAGQTIAVIDTGVATSHPALAGKVIHEVCYVAVGDGCPNGADTQEGPGAAAPPCDVGVTVQLCNHGTHVAGIAAGRAWSGRSSGVAPDAAIVAFRIFDAEGNASYWDLVDALHWVEVNASTYGISVVNLSLATNTLYAGSCDAVPSLVFLRDQVAALRAKRIAVVAATGNDDPGETGRSAVPACLSQTVSVSATDLADVRAPFAHLDRTTTLFAPGVSVLAPYASGGYGRMSGTSMAAPHVSGAIAVLRAAQTTNLTVPQLVSVLRATGRPLTTAVGRIPRLDLAAAVRSPLPPASVTATHGSGRATVTWPAASPGIGGPVTGYRITSVPSGIDVTVGASTRSRTFTGLRNGSRYQFRVQALSATGSSSPRTSNLVIPKAPPPPHGFVDVPATAYYEQAVRWLKAERITSGVGGTAWYKPNDPVTRGQMATFLWRLMGSPTGSPRHGFVDVPAGAYYEQAVRWLKASGITTGVGGSNRFEPNQAVTRAQMATFLHRLVRTPSGYGGHGFVDVPSNGYYERAVRWLKASGITTGVGGSNRFEPNQVVTRAQMAAFLHRLARNSAAWTRVAVASIPSSIVF